MGNLVEHARRELTRAGLFDADSDYGGAVGDAAMKLIEVHEAEGHSGFSNEVCVHLFSRLARYQALTPLTTDPAEWMQVDPENWQNIRQSSCFSKDGGKTYYDLDEKGCPTHTSTTPAAPPTGETNA